MKWLMFFLAFVLHAQDLPPGVEPGPGAVVTFQGGAVPHLRLEFGLVRITQPLTLQVETPSGVYHLENATAVIHTRALVSSFGSVRWTGKDDPFLAPPILLLPLPALLNDDSSAFPSGVFTTGGSLGTVQIEFE